MDLSRAMPDRMTKCLVERPSVLESFHESFGANAERPSPLMGWLGLTIVGQDRNGARNGRFRQCSLDCPAQFSESIFKNLSAYASATRPLSYCHGLAIELYVMICASVVLLLNCCGPAAVAWLVVPVYVNAVDAVRAGWRLAHIAQECLERLSPCLADFNSSTTIVFVLRKSFVRASLDHCFPDDVNTSSTVAMRRLGPRSGYRLKAPATPCVAGAKASSCRVGRSAAVASAKPRPLGFLVDQPHFAMNCCKVSEFLPR